MAAFGIRNYLANAYLLRRPRIIPKVMRGFWRGLVLRKPTLKTIEILPTHRCDSKCVMCSVAKYQANPGDEMTIAEYRALADQAHRLGAIAFSILGGEPTLRRDLEEIITALRPRDFFVMMVTNSLTLTRDRLAALKKAGLAAIGVSLDNVDEAANDVIRGAPGHANRVRQVIEWARELDLPVNVCSVAFHGRLDEFQKILEYSRRNGFAVGGGAVGYVGRGQDSEQMLLDADENHQLRQLLRDYPGLRFDWSLSYRLRHCCPAGKEKICVSAVGDVVGCSMNPISFGNVRREPLAGIWRRMNEFEPFKTHFPGCLVAENRDYIDRYLKPIADWPVNPVAHDEHPAVRAGKTTP
jgi:MoaA/NifB/PqqE/SkfB family radical SAM enzyme